MPTYEYRCPDGHDFEKFTQKMSDAKSELPCPTCGKVAARRLSAGGGLVFKGSGFYITDYGKDGKKDQRAATAKAESGSKGDASTTSGAPKAESSSTSDSRSESKSDSKTDSKSGSKSDSKAAPAAAATPAPSTKPKSGPEK
jgi:putative FmdB family regulatory protein